MEYFTPENIFTGMVLSNVIAACTQNEVLAAANLAITSIIAGGVAISTLSPMYDDVDYPVHSQRHCSPTIFSKALKLSTQLGNVSQSPNLEIPENMQKWKEYLNENLCNKNFNLSQQALGPNIVLIIKNKDTQQEIPDNAVVFYVDVHDPLWVGSPSFNTCITRVY